MAELPHLLDGRAGVDALALVKELHLQGLDHIVGHDLLLPGVDGVEEHVGLLLVDDLVAQRQHVAERLAGQLVIEAVDLLEMRGGDLFNVLRHLDLGDDLAVFVLDRDQLVHAAEDRLGLGGDEALTDAEGVDLRALVQKVAHQVFVERVGRHDLHVRIARRVQHLARLDGQVRNVARVQADTLGAHAHGRQHLVGHADGVGHARLEHIIGIDQEDAVVRVDLGVGLERLVLRVKHLHPGVRHGAARRDLVVAVGQHAGRALAAADVGCARAVDRTVVALCTARTELEHGPALGRTGDAAGLGSDQGLVVDGQKDHRLDKLRLHHRPGNRHDRLTREDGRALGHRPHVALELEMGQVVQKLLVKTAAAAQVIDVLLCKVQVLKIMYELLHARHHGIAAAVRHPAEKHIEIGAPVAHPFLEIAVGHGELIKVGQHGQVFVVHHNLLPLINKPAPNHQDAQLNRIYCYFSPISPKWQEICCYFVGKSRPIFCQFHARYE